MILFEIANVRYVDVKCRIMIETFVLLIINITKVANIAKQ